MQAGLIRPGPRTLEKLARFKQRYQYNTLRSVGVPETEAKKFSRSTLSDASNIAAQYRQTAINIAGVLSKLQKKKIDPAWIMYHMMKGERDIEDWDKYITALTAP